MALDFASVARNQFHQRVEFALVTALLPSRHVRILVVHGVAIFVIDKDIAERLAFAICNKLSDRVVVGFGFANDNLWPIVTSLISTPIANESKPWHAPLLSLAQSTGLLAGAMSWVSDAMSSGGSGYLI